MKTYYVNIFFAFLAITSQIVFAVTLIRNWGRNKSVTAWLQEEGTTGKEKTILSVSFVCILVFAVLGATWGRL